MNWRQSSGTVGPQGERLPGRRVRAGRGEPRGVEISLKTGRVGNVPWIVVGVSECD